MIKCYPRTTKGAVDVKPNSSELSYLLFYAQSRRSKIQKIGAFLEKKTAKDVYRMHLGKVQVTLQILAALVEKSPKDLPLIAPYVLKILEQVLRSNDITMVESSIPTFEAFCEHHDSLSLLADQIYLRQYESVVRQYACLASTTSSPGKTQPSRPVSMRWRNTGLQAIKGVVSSNALSSGSGRQLDVMVPMILENLWTDNLDFLDTLVDRAHIEEKVDAGAPLKRKNSVATVRTADNAGDTNPLALSGTALDVDKLAEEDIGVLAMQCLKQIFVVPNRSQIHAATLALLKFIEERVNHNEVLVSPNHNTDSDSGWAIKMFDLVSQWAPVQDRYTILITTLDNMIRRPLKDDTLQHHIVLAAMIGSLLRSDINLIGLSVMDVLLQLIAQLRRLVQMPGDPNMLKADLPEPGRPDSRSPAAVRNHEAADRTAAQRKELLGRLQHCIGDLATHVYYADQVSDMISTILQKLRPSKSGFSNTNTGNNSPAGEKVDTRDLAPSADDGHFDSLFSLTIAKKAALKAIKAILLVANPRSKMAGNTVSLSRNRVPIQVWEGTQWLLRDADGHVRKAYADALVTWLDRETTKADLKARDETASRYFSRSRAGRETAQDSLVKRAVSSASPGDRPIKTSKTHFLQLLHVAIYDNALQYVEYETDVVLLHVLLSKLVTQLGINAAQYGVPMVFRLQEDIQDVETPVQKVRLGSLCHGYFWTLTEKFEFEGSVVGRAIHNEIVRRRSKHFWVEGVHVPPPLLELVGTPGMARPQPRLPLSEIESEALLPFDDRASLVECICASYREHTVSPPASPAGTPARNFTQPILSSAGGAMTSIPVIETRREVPPYLRDQMLADWSRESAVAATEAASTSASLNGSRTGTTHTNRNRLAVNGTVLNGYMTSSPHGSQPNLRPSSSPTAGNLAAPTQKLRKSSLRSNVSPAPSGRARQTSAGVTSVEQLKLALSGRLRSPIPASRAADDDDASSDDSMVSYEMTPSELSFNPAATAATETAIPGQPVFAPNEPLQIQPPSRPASENRDRKASGPLNSHPIDADVQPAADYDDVPPVPPLPSNFSPNTKTVHIAIPLQQPQQTVSQSRPTTGRKVTRSRAGDSVLSASWAGLPPAGEEGGRGDRAAMDLNELLKGIDPGKEEEGSSLGFGSGSPPY